MYYSMYLNRKIFGILSKKKKIPAETIELSLTTVPSSASSLAV